MRIFCDFRACIKFIILIHELFCTGAYQKNNYSILFLISISGNSCLILYFHRSREEPTLITALAGKHITSVCAGSTYSAAISANGDLFTWGRGNYGRLGHGSSEDQCYPTIVAALKGHKVVDVACGSGDAQTLAVTDTGNNLFMKVF